MKLERSDRGPLVAFILPAIVMMVVFFVIPVLYVVVISLFKWNGISAPQTVWFENFIKLLKNSTFQRSLKNNIIVALVTVPTSIGLAILMAIFANKVKIGKGLVRISFFYPTLLPMVAVAMIFTEEPSSRAASQRVRVRISRASAFRTSSGPISLPSL